MLHLQTILICVYSGGPLVTENMGSYDVIGVVSFGVPCGYSEHPAVYGRVSKQLDWIKQKTAGSWNTFDRFIG